VARAGRNAFGCVAEQISTTYCYCLDCRCQPYLTRAARGLSSAYSGPGEQPSVLPPPFSLSLWTRLSVAGAPKRPISLLPVSARATPRYIFSKFSRFVKGKINCQTCQALVVLYHNDRRKKFFFSSFMFYLSQNFLFSRLWSYSRMSSADRVVKFRLWISFRSFLLLVVLLLFSGTNYVTFEHNSATLG